MFPTNRLVEMEMKKLPTVERYERSINAIERKRDPLIMPIIDPNFIRRKNVFQIPLLVAKKKMEASKDKKKALCKKYYRLFVASSSDNGAGSINGNGNGMDTTGSTIDEAVLRADSLEVVDEQAEEEAKEESGQMGVSGDQQQQHLKHSSSPPNCEFEPSSSSLTLIDLKSVPSPSQLSLGGMLATANLDDLPQFQLGTPPAAASSAAANPQNDENATNAMPVPGFGEDFLDLVAQFSHMKI